MRKESIKRIVIMIIGNIFLGTGVAIFRLSALGNDPYTGMNLAVADLLPLSFPTYQLIVNLVLFAIEFVFGRKLIGWGTIFNAVFVGYIVEFAYNLMVGAFGSSFPMWGRLIIVVIGVIVVSFGVSLYTYPNEGVSPYDSMSIILDKRLKKIPYFWCRIFTDGLCALICFLAGGIVGIGMLVATFGFGPFIQFFNRHVASKLVKPKCREKL